MTAQIRPINPNAKPEPPKVDLKVNTPAPEPKRSKTERLEGGRGTWMGALFGFIAGSFFGVTIALQATGALLPIMGQAYIQAQAIRAVTAKPAE